MMLTSRRPILVAARRCSATVFRQEQRSVQQSSYGRMVSSQLFSSFSSLSDIPTSAVVNDNNDNSKSHNNNKNSVSLVNIAQASGIDMQWFENVARQRTTPLRLADLYKFGGTLNRDQRLRNAQFIYKELPIRIAHRVVDLLTLPHGLSNAKPIQEVATMYLQYLHKLENFPIPTTYDDEIKFTELLTSFVMNRETIPNSIYAGVREWRSSTSIDDVELSKKDTINRLQEMEDALYRFFTARVGLRFLTEHHVLSSQTESANALWDVISILPPPLGDTTNRKNERLTMRGCIQPNVNVVNEVRKVVELVKRQTNEYYNGLCPEIEIVECVQQKFEFTHVPHHLHYMFYELLKNSCRASIRWYHKQVKQQQQLNQQAQLGALNKVALDDMNTKVDIPPIRVIIVMGDEDVTVKIADRGGGIPRSLMATIWKFAHSTSSKDELDTAFGRDGFTGAKIRGFGLPLARVYARYFGGELTLKSTEGYGLDAYLHLPRLGDCCENLPLRVRDSPGEHDSIPTFIPNNNNAATGSSMNKATTSTTTRTFSSTRRTTGSARAGSPITTK